MGRNFLVIYVTIGILIVLLNIIANIATGDTVQLLSYRDWLLLISACSVLAICETIDKINN